jgi:hypothetical protein
MKIRSVGVELFHADGRTDRHDVRVVILRKRLKTKYAKVIKVTLF